MRKIVGVFIISICLALLIIAAFPQQGNAEVIYGCVAKNGALSIVNGPNQCGSKDTPISWNSVEGINAAVHGVVNSDGTVSDGVGFSSSFASDVYYITFDQAFSGNPHCAITPFESPPTATCAILGYGPNILDVSCVTPAMINGLLTSKYVQVSFFFMCIL
jgi:hypothetical protein